MLFRSTGFTATLKGCSVLIAFAASLIYARTLGPRGYGLYAYVMAWVTMATMFASLGLPQYLVREGAKTAQSLIWLRRWADVRVLVAGLLTAVILCMLCLVPQAGQARSLFLIAAPIPLLANLSAVRQSLLQAQGLIVRSQWPKLLLAPASIIGGLLVIWVVQGDIAPWQLMALTAAAAILPVIANALQLKRATRSIKTETQTRVSLPAALPFIWLSGMYLLISRTDLIMLGALRGAEEAGVYAVASRAAELLLFLVAASNLTLAPMFAKLHQNGDTESLLRVLSYVRRRMFLATAPFAVVMIIFAPELLHSIYGAPFAQGAAALRILAGAQMLSIMSGPIGALLNMSGHERSHLKAIGFGVAINVLLNALLIPPYGATGAAAATCASMVTSRIMLLGIVRSKIAITN